MDRDLLTAEFLDALQQRADAEYAGKLHQAFVAWYVEVEFGERVEWRFTDDASDGRIDALVFRPGEIPPVVVIQSKFSERIGSGQLGRNAYRDFRTVVEAFRYGEEALKPLLSNVRDDVRHHYRRAHKKLRDVGHWAHAKKAFRIITTQRGRRSAEFDTIPRENFVYADAVLALYEQYRKGATPRARDLELEVEDKLAYVDRKRRVKSYLFNARVSDFRAYLEHNDVARLVARNIRFNLSGRVGSNVRRTYEEHPHDFWYLHNGLTLVCDEYEERNQRATLTNPSVVNGAQTLYAISGSSPSRSPALVTVRVIVRGRVEAPHEDDDWLQRVIRGVNTQNRVRAYDFRSNEPEQVELQGRFRDVRVFYERKRGERREYRNEARFRGFARLSLFRLGQILCSASRPDGSGVLAVKRGLEDVFANEKQYRRLFPARSKIGRHFERIYLAYRIYRLVERYGYKDARTFRKQRHGFWNAFWLAYLGITSVRHLRSRTSISGVRAAFDEFEGAGRTAQRAKRAIRQLTSLVWKAWRQGRRSDPEQWTPNNFFKVSYGTRTLLRVAFPKAKPHLRALGEHIAKAG